MPRPSLELAGGTYRPWYALYGNRLRKPEAKKEEQVELELAPIQQLIHEAQMHIFQHLDPFTLASAACVCKQWKSLASCQSLWRTACLNTWAVLPPEKLERSVMKNYGGSWKQMLIERPHLRYDGLYVSRNTYVRQGVVEFKEKCGVHLVTYYRYFRFFPTGTLLYRTSPLTVNKVAPSLAYKRNTNAKKSAHDTVMPGQWQMSGEQIKCAALYPMRPSAVMRTKARIRGTRLGAWNRIDLESITTYDTYSGTSTPLPVPNEEDDEEEYSGEDANVRSHSKGFGTFVFIHWDDVRDHVLNLPASKMDVWIPG